MAEQHLTKSELAIMEVMWEQEEALTASEIIKASGDKEWKNSSIHLMVNALLEKGFLEVAGFKKTTKNYARTFEPSMTREEYSMKQLQQEKKKNTRVFSGLFNTFVSEEISSESLQELSNLIESRIDNLDDEE